MHIRRLELQGFKSFKDKTVIHFDDGITGIVGPNGCGKSNVVDAFFWVMGEQNARLLRGQSMDDLIFSGADKAAPGAFAEVTLILEMPADVSGPNAPAGASAKEPATLPTREVAITRKLYRTGESEYFMNRIPCRLKDIQELFMDTGVGSRGYSIIQQGQIAKIVQAKPEDRRTMIEEVAGIVKYKKRKIESSRKLETTNQNLLRVTDVINELENQKRQMERQADKARKYKEWKERLQGIELHFNAMKWEDFSNRVGTLEQEIENLTVEDLALTTARETAETQISQMRLELAQAQKVHEEHQSKWIDAGRALNNAENDLKYSQKNLGDLKTSFAQLEKDADAETSMVHTLSAQFEAVEQESATIDEEFATAEANRRDKEESANLKKQELEQTERQHEEAKRRLFQLASEMERAKSAASFAEVRLLELAESIERISTERATQESFMAEAAELKEAASERLAIARTEADALRTQIQDLAQNLSQKNAELDGARKELSKLISEQARLRTTLKTLEDQKLRHEDASKGVKSIFQKILPKHANLEGSVGGTLADLLKVSNGMETAAEAILGKSLDLILTSDSSAHTLLSEALKAETGGRAAFADVKKLASLQNNSAISFQAPADLASDVNGPLSQFVSLEGENKIAGADIILTTLLQNVISVKSAAAAEKLSAQFPQHTFVTNDGEICRGGWFMEGGDKSSVSGSYVGRNREIAELTEKLEALSLTIEATQEKISVTEAELSSLSETKRTSEEDLRAKQADVSQKASEEASLQARASEAQKTLDKAASEYSRIKAEEEKLRTTEVEAKEKASTLEAEKIDLEEKSADFGVLLAQLKAAYEEAQQDLVNARIRASNISEQKNSLKTRLDQSRRALDQAKSRVDNMLEQARKRQDDSESTSLRIIELEEKITVLRDEWIAVEDVMKASKDRLDVINNDVETFRSEAQVHSNRERAIKESLLNKRLEFQRLAGDRDALAQNTFERYGIVMAEYCLMPETMEQVQVLRDAGENTINDIQNEVTLLREKIRKLGDVNPAAVEEYDAIVERYNLLSTQKTDLEKAMNDLQSTVDRINKVSKERFERAFAEVNNHFKRVFPVIFGGGHAHLTLTNPEDMLETGVDITAQPPGKKPQNINLLSGGEKTLTAISLLFSIFLVKPSPFCLLDEVDAPLDDANIGRFNALLREMSKRSQFIIITHNKRTMELNDKLYGVTMEDAGISKMVSIQLSASA